MLANIYFFLEVFVPFLPLAFGIFAYKSLDLKLRVLFYYVCFASIASVYSYLVSITSTNSMPGAHIYVLGEFVVLTLFYANYINEYVNRKFIWSIIGAFSVFSILNALFIQKITVYPNIPRAVESIVMVVFSVLYFHKVMVEAKIKKLSKEPMIWINTAMLIYFSVNFFFHISFPVALANSVEFAKGIIYFFWATNIVFYTILTIGFYKQKKLTQ